MKRFASLFALVVLGLSSIASAVIPSQYQFEFLKPMEPADEFTYLDMDNILPNVWGPRWQGYDDNASYSLFKEGPFATLWKLTYKQGSGENEYSLVYAALGNTALPPTSPGSWGLIASYYPPESEPLDIGYIRTITAVVPEPVSLGALGLFLPLILRRR